MTLPDRQTSINERADPESMCHITKVTAAFIITE
jgi:hypothetical protein